MPARRKPPETDPRVRDALSRLAKLFWQAAAEEVRQQVQAQREQRLRVERVRLTPESLARLEVAIARNATIT